MKPWSFSRLMVLAMLLAILSVPAFAASPASGSIASKNGEATWNGGPFYVSNPATTGGLVKPVPCDVGQPACDSFRLTITAGNGIKQVLVAIAPAAGFETDDYDLQIYNDKGVR